MKIRDLIRQEQSEWKGSELSTKRMVKSLRKVFKDVVNELKNSLPTLVDSVSEVSHFIPEPRMFQKSPYYQQTSKRIG